MAADLKAREIVGTMLRKLFLGIALPVLFSACTPYIYPTIDDYCPMPVAAEQATKGQPRNVQASCTDLSTVARSVSTIRGVSQSVEQKIDNQVKVSAALDVATFGLATAFAFKVIQGGALTTGAKNVALSAGATYTAGTLFFPRSKEMLYLNADLALACVANRGNSLLYTYDQANAMLATGPGIDDQSGQNCDNWSQLEEELAKAKMVRQTVRNSDAGFAGKLDEARFNIQSTLAQQLVAQYPSPEAILYSGKTAAAAAATMVPAAIPLVSSPAAAAKAACRSDTQAMVNTAIGNYQLVSSQLSQRINAIGDLSQGCTTNLANPVKPLIASQPEVKLMAGDNSGVVLTIEGGRPGITAQWVGQNPGAVASFVWLNVDRSLRVFAPTSGSTGGPYRLRLIDSALVPATYDVTVTVK